MRTVIQYLSGGLMANRTDAGRVAITVRHFSNLRNALGAPLLSAFARAFVGLDHLASVLDFLRLNGDHCGENTIERDRNITMGVFWCLGFQREMAHAIGSLERAGLAKLVPEQDAFVKLLAIAKRWNSTPEYLLLRSKFAFHFDSDLVFNFGTEALAVDAAPLVVFEGDGATNSHMPNVIRSRASLGLSVLLAGTCLNLEELKPHIDQAIEDLDQVFALLEGAFVDAMASGTAKPVGPDSSSACFRRRSWVWLAMRAHKKKLLKGAR